MTSSSSVFARRLASLCLLAGLVAMPQVATALPPAVLFEGVLQSGGAPVTDGNYAMRFAIYPDAQAQQAIWTEGPTQVTVSGGRFAVRLGESTPLSAVALAAAASPTLGVQVENEPELPRMALASVPYAHVAGSLACTGCVGVGALKFDGDIDLGGHSIKAKNATISGDLSAANVTASALTASRVTAAAFVGDGSKLTGIAQPKGDCKPGESVVGIAADGTLKCAASAGGALGTVSGGLLTNEFVEVFDGASAKIGIPDNTGSDATAQIDVPDIGIAKALKLQIELENTDLSKVSMILLPPDDKKVGWILCDPCGQVDQKKLTAVYDPNIKPKTGDVGAWIGQNPKGFWTLKVKDISYCIPQAPGNAALCDAVKGTDGWISTFRITITTVSNQKLQATGGLEVATGLKLPVAGQPPVVCSPKTRGYTYVDDATDAVRICRKTGLWGTFSIFECGNGKLENGETCDDGNTKPGDGCDALCVKECGNGKVDAGEECDPNDAATKLNCTAECKKQVYGKLWLETPDYLFYPVHYPHGAYKESLAVQTCKSVGLRLWRDESGSKTDPNWAYDFNGNHNLGGHDICYKVNSATSGQQQSHTGEWKLFGKDWSDDMKLHAKASNGQTVVILNHIAHTGSDENNASYCRVTPQASSVTWIDQTNGQPNSPTSVVLCAKGK